MPLSSAEIEGRIARKEVELAEINGELDTADFDYQGVLNDHIQSLKRFNELKDTALELIQTIATQRNVKVSVVFDEIGLDSKDE